MACKNTGSGLSIVIGDETHPGLYLLTCEKADKSKLPAPVLRSGPASVNMHYCISAQQATRIDWSLSFVLPVSALFTHVKFTIPAAATAADERQAVVNYKRQIHTTYGVAQVVVHKKRGYCNCAYLFFCVTITIP
ncbi:MAG TPA: hypothetical protein VFI29_00140 [Hanamia sp.]|nr:hypothetical protein [Hanamia sp.]